MRDVIASKEEGREKEEEKIKQQRYIEKSECRAMGVLSTYRLKAYRSIVESSGVVNCWFASA